MLCLFADPAEDCGSEDKFCSIVKTYVPNLQGQIQSNNRAPRYKVILELSDKE